jgi:hypothetical protein
MSYSSYDSRQPGTPQELAVKRIFVLSDAITRLKHG